MASGGREKLPDVLRTEALIGDGGAQKIGDYQPISDGATSSGVRVPQPFARRLGVRDSEGIPTYVDLENGWVIAKIPSAEEVQERDA